MPTNPTACQHEWEQPWLQMVPEGYWKPTGQARCRKCKVPKEPQQYGAFYADSYSAPDVQVRLSAIRTRIEDATKGPWIAEDIGAGTVACGVVAASGEVVVEHDFIATRNADFVANARQDMPYLLTLLAAADTQHHRDQAEIQRLNERVREAVTHECF